MKFQDRLRLIATGDAINDLKHHLERERQDFRALLRRGRIIT